MNQVFEPAVDPRRTFFLPVTRIVLAEKMAAPAALIGCRRIQPREILPEGSCFEMVPGSRLILDFGRELAGGIRLVTGDLGPEGGRLRLRFGESVSETLLPQELCHTVRVEELTLPTMGAVDFGNTGFRFAALEALTPLTLVNVVAILRCREVEQLGRFRCNDERLNRIWQTCVETVHLNMQEFLLDGIKRDRLVWQGDMHPELAVINAVYGEQAIARESLDFSRDFTPLPGWMNDVSAYTLWWILCQHDFFMYHGNLAYLREQHTYLKEVVRRLIQFIGGDGREKLPAIRFLDWPTRDDEAATHAGLQALLTLALRSVKNLAPYLQDSELAAAAESALQKMRGYTAPFTPRKAPNALAVLAGIADPAACNREILAVNPGADLGTFMGFYTLSARCQAGDVSGALETIRTYWGAMLDLGATSFWEHFDLEWAENAGRIDELPVPGKRDIHAECGDHSYEGVRHSLCHGWAGGPAALMPAAVTGLRLLEPGFRKIALTPVSGGLEFFECTLPTPHGLIEVRYDRKRAQPEIILPDGVETVGRQ